MKQNLLLLIALFFSIPLFAEGELEVDSLIHLNSVVVSANKIEVNRNSVPLTISIIDREQIESSSESALLPVLSEQVPGLFVTEKGITGFGVSTNAAGTINIRGVGSGNKVLVLFDGQPQWAGLFGHSLPDTYVASDVEKVEVIRGPGSLLYGSNAMGGVINIITRRHLQDGRRTQARVMYGSYNTQKYMLNNGYNIGKFSSFISINHDRTDGHRDRSDFNITNGFFNIGYQVNQNYKMKGEMSLAKSKSQNPGKLDNPIYDNKMDIFRGTASIGLENQYDKISGAFQLFYNWGNHEINDGYYTDQKPKDYLFRSHDRNLGVLFYESFRLFPGNNFTIGIDYKNWGGHAWNSKNDGKNQEIIDTSVNETAGYIIMQQDFFEKIGVNAGIRYEHNSAFGGAWIPQAGLTFRPFEGNVWKASWSKGFRSPNIRELYMFKPKNPNLKPENMMNYEVSVGQSFLNGRLSAELTAFYLDGKDMIRVAKIDGKPLNVNTGTFTNKGLEAELRYQILKNLSFHANYSFLDQNKPIPGAPKHKFYAGSSYSPGRFTINLALQSVFGLYTDETCQKEEDYTTLNAKISYHIGNSRDKGMDLFLKGENLTAARYSINDGFPMPKASFMSGIQVCF